LAASSARNKVAGLIAALESDPNATIIEADVRLFRQGLNLCHARSDKEWTLTDCISFIVMDDQRLSEALTGDHRFEQAGFRAALRQPTPGPVT